MGTIKLMKHQIGGAYAVEKYYYRSVKDRKHMVVIWRRTYGDRFDNHFLQVAPGVNLTK